VCNQGRALIQVEEAREDRSKVMSETQSAAGGALIRRLRSGVAAVAAATLLLAGLAGPAHALDRRSTETVVIPADEVVRDDVMLSGRVARIDGRVEGDVYAFAQYVTVGGTIEGDLIAGAQEVTVDGTVRGSVRAAGATVQVNGSVERNVTSAAQSLRLGSGGRVGGSWIAAGDSMSLAGDVGGSVTAAADSLLLQGRVGREADVAAGSLSLSPGARIGGDLSYHTDQPIEVPPAAVAGRVQFHQTERRPEHVDRAQANQFFGAVGNLLSLMWLAGSAVVGLAILHAFPRFVARFLDALERRPVPSFVVGVIGLVATLPLTLLLAITIVGIPASVVLAGGYFAGLFAGWLLLAVAVGSILVGLVRRGGGARHLAWAFLLGLLVLHVGSKLPFLGPLVTFVALALGLGTLLTALYRTWQREPRLDTPEPIMGGEPA
jgi:cytoskeletal protein CcmA (bactofilin family)